MNVLQNCIYYMHIQILKLIVVFYIFLALHKNLLALKTFTGDMNTMGKNITIL